MHICFNVIRKIIDIACKMVLCSSTLHLLFVIKKDHVPWKVDVCFTVVTY